MVDLGDLNSLGADIRRTTRRSIRFGNVISKYCVVRHTFSGGDIPPSGLELGGVG